jgi:D-alanyl-D-alanine carboxypeptidase
MTSILGTLRVARSVFCWAIPLLFAVTLQSNSAYARYAAIVLDADSGKVLHAANPDTRNYPASLTKMMTLYLLFEALESGKLSLRHQLSVSKRAAGMAPSKLGVKLGESISVETAILALVTKSANDAAVVVAEALGGTEAKFARLMTKKARMLGMKRTSFRNASGLPNRRQLSTARDMAILALRLVRDYPTQYRYFSRDRYHFRGKEFKNHNNLLRTYPGTDGVKTGYIRASGFNLAASVARDGRRLIGVVFGGKTAKSRDKHMAKLLDREFRKLGAPLLVVSKTKPRQPAPRATLAKKVKSKMAAVSKNKVAASRPTPAKKPLYAEAHALGLLQKEPKEWSIQVGAYKNFEPARRALRNAIGRIRNLTSKTRVSIAPFGAGDTLMYRARLIGLTGSAAQSACKRLERRKIPCVAIPPERIDDVSAQQQTAAHPQR